MHGSSYSKSVKQGFCKETAFVCVELANTNDLKVAAWEIPITVSALRNSFGLKQTFKNYLKLGKTCSSAGTLGNVLVMISLTIQLEEWINWLCTALVCLRAWQNQE